MAYPDWLTAPMRKELTDLGATVIGTVGSPEKADVARARATEAAASCRPAKARRVIDKRPK